MNKRLGIFLYVCVMSCAYIYTMETKEIKTGLKEAKAAKPEYPVLRLIFHSYVQLQFKLGEETIDYFFDEYDSDTLAFLARELLKDTEKYQLKNSPLPRWSEVATKVWRSWGLEKEESWDLEKKKKIKGHLGNYITYSQGMGNKVFTRKGLLDFVSSLS